jgi:hypothetical protein
MMVTCLTDTLTIIMQREDDVEVDRPAKRHIQEMATVPVVVPVPAVVAAPVVVQPVISAPAVFIAEPAVDISLISPPEGLDENDFSMPDLDMGGSDDDDEEE